jgi:hypothetical protein
MKEESIENVETRRALRTFESNEQSEDFVNK